MFETIEPGTVWLVGAGPGDPDLLTRKAAKLIAAADIVFYDALVGPGVIDLIPPEVERVSVGKRSGRHSKDQDAINDLLLSSAQAGQRVVRLKGGDPAIFARTAEEVEHLSAHGVRVRICPGITAASAAIASAGGALSVRGHARKLTFITAHSRAGDDSQTDWGALADAHSTLAIYMGKAAASGIAANLARSGRCGSTPVLVVENASLPNERLVQTRLDLLAVATGATVTDGPAVLIIGEAARSRQPLSPDEDVGAQVTRPVLPSRHQWAG
jgi:uroporphyrin-III C-methyltransferase